MLIILTEHNYDNNNFILFGENQSDSVDKWRVQG